MLPAWPDSALLLCFTQAIEAKEGLEIQNESVTLASISYQACGGGVGPAFLLYGWLAGLGLVAGRLYRWWLDCWPAGWRLDFWLAGRQAGRLGRLRFPTPPVPPHPA